MIRFPFAGLLAALLLLARPAHAQLVHDVIDAPVSLSPVEVQGDTESVFRSADPGRPFTGLALEGIGGEGDLEGTVRFLQDGAEIDWRPLYVVRSATDGAFLAAYHGETVRRGAFEVRFLHRPGSRITVGAAGVFDGRLDQEETAEAGDVAFPYSGKAAPQTVFPPALITRAEWNAAAFRGTPGPLSTRPYTRMTFHHAAGFGAVTRDEGLAQVKAIQEFHQNGRGWSDIGYHFVVDQSGRVYQGRPFLDASVRLDDVPALALGAHAGGANTGNIGVCVLGCYHPPEGTGCTDVLAPAVRDSLVTLFAFLGEAYAVEASSLIGHRDVSDTACPGNTNYGLLPGLRDDVLLLQQTGNARIASGTLDATLTPQGFVRLAVTFTEDNGIAGVRLERVQDGQPTLLYAGTSPDVPTITDAGLTGNGPVRYDLYVTDGAGRRQRVATAELSPEPPGGYVLAETFPNPAQGAATLRYYLEQDGVVHLRVYDAAGRTVAEAVSGAFQEGGRWHTAALDVSGLAGGTYFYRLTVEGFGSTVLDATRTLVVVP